MDRTVNNISFRFACGRVAAAGKTEGNIVFGAVYSAGLHPRLDYVAAARLGFDRVV
jgi:hypothetical protein